MRKEMIAAAAGMMLGISVLGMSVTTFAAESTAQEVIEEPFEKSSYSMDEAIEAALADAELSRDAVTFTKRLSDCDSGLYVYDIHFIIPNETKYEYEIDAKTCAIVNKEIEPWEADDSIDYEALLSAGTDYFDYEDPDVSQALADAIITAMDSIEDKENSHMYKLGTDYDDGQLMYKVGFLIPGKEKCEFKFDCATGSLIGQETDPWEAEDDMEYASILEEASLQDADTADDTAAPAGAVTEEDARNIALEDAGFSAEEVTMLQSHQDFDDGIEMFDVSFNGPDGREYSYDISVSDGRILDKEAEFDD